MTSSEIRFKYIVDLLRVAKNAVGFKDDPAISNAKGRVYSTSDLDDMLISMSGDFFEEQMSLFLLKIKNILDIKEKYHSNQT